MIDYKSSVGPTLGEESAAFNLAIRSANILDIQVFSDNEPTHCLYGEEGYAKASVVIEVTSHYQFIVETRLFCHVIRYVFSAEYMFFFINRSV